MKLLLRNNTEVGLQNINVDSTNTTIYIYPNKEYSYGELVDFFNNKYNTSKITLEHEVIEGFEYDYVTSDRENNWLVVLVRQPKTQQEIIEELQQEIEILKEEKDSLEERIEIIESQLEITEDSVEELTEIEEITEVVE